MASKQLRIFWFELSGAIGYRVYIEIPGSGTYEATSKAYKTTWTLFPNCWETAINCADIAQYVPRAMVIRFYVVGVDAAGLDGPVSPAYAYMFYP